MLNPTLELSLQPWLLREELRQKIAPLIDKPGVDWELFFKEASVEPGQAKQMRRIA
jgi:hypothetical protein